jgi:ligand-binding sensor domain-containing protein
MRLADRGKGSSVFRLLLLLLLLLTCRETPAEHLPIKTYTVADGLPRDYIYHIKQDTKGFLWFCTPEGLSRFDGYQFTSYGSLQGLPSRWVYDFLEARNGTYWVATDKGLCRLVPDPMPQPGISAPNRSQRFVVYTPGDTTAAQSINSICEDQAGNIWCGTDAGLFRFAQQNGQWNFTFIDIIQPAEHEGTKVAAIIEDRQQGRASYNL